MNYEENSKKKYSVPAVDTAFKLITLLSRKKYQSSTLTEIANALDLNPTTCFRILYELQQLSVVKYEQRTKRYTLGPYLVVLGERAKEHINYLSLINSYLEKMTAETGITSFLVSRVGRNRSTIVSKVEGDNFGVRVSVGRHFDLLDGAYGKCIIAYANEADMDYCLKSHERVNDYNLKEVEDLKKELFEVKKNGYAISFNETINGIFGVAAPIINFNNQVEMSIAFAGVSAQYSIEELKPLIDLVKDSAQKISSKLNMEFEVF
ncbi:IclR family transcriptional regulator [Psychrobacillus sp. NPDC096426]|uniref:IclR family transcriptional regulator n=1 Tax=Psychrobacillus sp. NPDC096426 TaxID=3364491 RepID=UPI003820A9BD